MEPAPSARAGDGSDRGGRPRTGMLDTRMYQDLEPLRLPSKLRDRIARVQRRAAAEKDGVSIFTATTNAILGDDPSLHASEQRKPTLRRESNSVAVLSPSASSPSPLAREKMHLPEVVLSHKMREFEAKMNVNALFVDPLENNLHHLTIEDKERVMLTMQAKIQAITAEVDAHFVAIKTELDAHGIFDSAANYQRAQALCLVELQKRCKLEKIRDDAMREVLGEEGNGGPATVSDMEGKLNELLTRNGGGGGEGGGEGSIMSARRRQVMTSSQLQRNTKSSMGKRRPAVVRRLLSPMKTTRQLAVAASFTSAPSNQAETEQGQQTSRTLRPLEEPTPSSSSTAALPVEDWTTRHPHIVQALTALTAQEGGGAPPSVDSMESSTSTSRRLGQSGAEEDGTPRSSSSTTRVLTLAEEWGERSTSYRTIARRVGEELRQRCARERWDSTLHFTTPSPPPLSAVLLQRVRHCQATPSARRSEEEERQRAQRRELTNTERRKAAETLYSQTRELIQSKRQRAAIKASRASSAIGVRVARPVATTATKSATSRSVTLSGSASAPALVQPEKPTVDGAPNVIVTESKEEERSRKLSMLIDRKRPSRLRGDSLIGAPVATDLTTLGHYSNARLEERRQSAQTWAWHHPEQRQRDLSTGIHAVVEEGSDEEEEDGDEEERRDTMGDNDDKGSGGANSMGEEGEGDDETEDESDGDDTRSVRSSRSGLKQPRRRRSKSSGTGTRHPPRRLSPVRGPRGSRLLSRHSNSSTLSGSSGGMFGGVPFTANAQVLQHRLEELWRVLDFPFSNKLVMLEKYADSPADVDALARALGHWEAAAELVAIREKLRHIVDEYEELETVKASSLLSPAEWSYLLMQGVEIPPNAIALSASSLVTWIHRHLESVTHRCEKAAQQLKAATGDELVFQGQRYPPRV